MSAVTLKLSMHYGIWVTDNYKWWIDFHIMNLGDVLNNIIYNMSETKKSLFGWENTHQEFDSNWNLPRWQIQCPSLPCQKFRTTEVLFVHILKDDIN